MGVFDLGDAEAFFGSIKQVYSRYCASKAKSTEDLLYVIMGLNHLREWIAPGFKKGNGGQWLTATSLEEKFSKFVFEDRHHTTVRQLCNQTKHGGVLNTGTDHTLTIDEWPDVDSVKSFDLGPASDHWIDQKSVTSVIDPLVDLYADWFSGKWPSSNSSTGPSQQSKTP